MTLRDLVKFPFDDDTGILAIENDKPGKLFFCDICLLTDDSDYVQYLDKEIISIDITYDYLSVYLNMEE